MSLPKTCQQIKKKLSKAQISKLIQSVEFRRGIISDLGNLGKNITKVAKSKQYRLVIDMASNITLKTINKLGKK